MGFQTGDHTADLSLILAADSAPELIGELVRGMHWLYTGKRSGQGREKRPFETVTGTLESVLVKIANEIIYYVDSEGWLTATWEESECAHTAKGWRVRGRLCGGPVEDVETELKAATYHDLEVRVEDSKWTAVLVIDT